MQASVQVEHVTTALEGLLAIMNYISERPAKGHGGDPAGKARDAPAPPDADRGGQLFANFMNMFGAEQHEHAGASSPVVEACCLEAKRGVRHDPQCLLLRKRS
jgi:hypothetical protein